MVKRGVLLKSLLVSMTILGTTPAMLAAASFDCSKAASKTEKAICEESALSRLDEIMAAEYRKALRTSDREAVKEGQRKWLKEMLAPCREARELRECIVKAYENRLLELGCDAECQKGQGSNADEEEDITRSLTMTCDYFQNKSSEHQLVSIAQTKDHKGKPASVKKFTRGKAESGNETFTVRAGQYAECVYPSGMRVRVKVGEGTPRAYGMCGGDPQVFMSLWVNERKIVSRLWFAGHCREQSGFPYVNFTVSGISDGVSVEKCHTAPETDEGEPTPANGSGKKGQPEPLTVCVDFPDISHYPKDLLEYPGYGTKLPKVGSIVIEKGSDPVCRAVLNDLKGDAPTLSKYHIREGIKLTRPDWRDATVELPEELAGGSESIFDFNNDGKLDRVFARDYATNYMHGSVLLVQPGNSRSRLIVAASPMDSSSIFLPCQMGTVRHNINDCPPFSQKNDEAGFSMKGRTKKDSVYFRGRYSAISPFIFRKTTFIEVSAISDDTRDFVAVLKPLPGGRFQEMCLLRYVSENF
ncbi:MAG: hypothetical protein GYA56_03040 [Geobacteraceae bacterium]|jgi:uncharacterized protein|nr:hypothetical protein [Geobacteraceae bacterium]